MYSRNDKAFSHVQDMNVEGDEFISIEIIWPKAKLMIVDTSSCFKPQNKAMFWFYLTNPKKYNPNCKPFMLGYFNISYRTFCKFYKQIFENDYIKLLNKRTYSLNINI